MSREFYIVYDPATGAEVQRGSGPEGCCGLQHPGNGWRVLPMPREAMRGPLAADALRPALLAEAVARGAAAPVLAAIEAADDVPTLLSIDIGPPASGN